MTCQRSTVVAAIGGERHDLEEEDEEAQMFLNLEEFTLTVLRQK